MNKRIRKIKAFTLSELLVVLLITVIVVGLAFSVLSLVNRHMLSIQGSYEQNTEINLLRQALWSDFNSYHKLDYNAGSTTLSCENEMGVVHYNFERDWVIRAKDTFHIAVDKKLFYFDGIEQLSGAIDAIELSTKEQDIQGKIFVYKTNAATRIYEQWVLK